MEGILSPTHSFFNTEKGRPERLSKLQSYSPFVVELELKPRISSYWFITPSATSEYLSMAK